MVRSKKIKKLYDTASISVILKKAATSPNDLQKVADKIGITIPISYRWIEEYNPDIETPQILNLGNKKILGTHWVCVYGNDYFDPFGMPPPPEVLIKKRVSYTPLTIQNSLSGGCGIYCILWIYYKMIDELDEFYSLFNMSNTNSDKDLYP